MGEVLGYASSLLATATYMKALGSPDSARDTVVSLLTTVVRMRANGTKIRNTEKGFLHSRVETRCSDMRVTLEMDG